MIPPKVTKSHPYLRKSVHCYLPITSLPRQRFYRLWVVEGHKEWRLENSDQALDLAGTLWFFPKHFKPGISYGEVEGFTFWFDDHFIVNNPMLGDQQGASLWSIRKPFVLSATDSFTAICHLCRDHQAYLSDHAYRSHPLAYTSATLLLLHLKEAALGHHLPPVARKKHPIADAFMVLLQQQYPEQHQPGFYADKLHATLASLRRYCQESYGLSPSQLIQQKLLEEAKKRLLETDQSIKQIAYSLGFEDESYFVRFFRQSVLLPPRAYRKSFLPNR